MEKGVLLPAGVFISVFAALVPVASAQYYPHLYYDWEGDGVGEEHPPQKFESCFACHEEDHGITKVCEDCHVEGGPGPFESGGGNTLSADYEAPLVYEHFYDAEDIDVSNQSYGVSLSTCFNIDPILERSCHGISYTIRDLAGGHFAFNENWTEPDTERDPYEYTAPTRFLPDTTDCLFCHSQPDEQIRISWGRPVQVNSTHSELSNGECYTCHVEGGAAPASFHSRELVISKKTDEGEAPVRTSEGTMMASLLVFVLIIFYLIVKIRGNSGD